MVMVLLFRIDEKIVTPTTVLLMTMVTIPGFLLHLFVLKDFTPTVMGYWLAAVPVVAVGAPLGALICSHMKRRSIVLLLLFLITLEFLCTLLLVPMSPPVLWASLATLVVCGSIDWVMSRAARYRPEALQTDGYSRRVPPAQGRASGLLIILDVALMAPPFDRCPSQSHSCRVGLRRSAPPKRRIGDSSAYGRREAGE